MHESRASPRSPAAGWTALVAAAVAAHAIVAPFTKVEESFNLHATHDLLFHGFNVTAYDHLDFPGVVPRTFLGAAALAGAAAPAVLPLLAAGTPKLAAQLAVRLTLVSGVEADGCVEGLPGMVGAAALRWCQPCLLPSPGITARTTLFRPCPPSPAGRADGGQPGAGAARRAAHLWRRRGRRVLPAHRAAVPPPLLSLSHPAQRAGHAADQRGAGRLAGRGLAAGTHLPAHGGGGEAGEPRVGQNRRAQQKPGVHADCPLTALVPELPCSCSASPCGAPTFPHTVPSIYPLHPPPPPPTHPPPHPHPHPPRLSSAATCCC